MPRLFHDVAKLKSRGYDLEIMQELAKISGDLSIMLGFASHYFEVIASAFQFRHTSVTSSDGSARNAVTEEACLRLQSSVSPEDQKRTCRNLVTASSATGAAAIIGMTPLIIYIG